MADSASKAPIDALASVTTADLQAALMKRQVEAAQDAKAAAQATYAVLVPVFTDATAYTFTDMMTLIQGFQAGDRPRLPDTDMALDALARAMAGAQRVVLKKVGAAA
jgi:hypothetical protein